MRNLTKTLAVVSLLAPANGHTLGIGEIKLHSALNQNLDAEISLTLSGESVSDIKVNLAPPEKFDEAGVSWTYFLPKIKFETITYSNGLAVIKLTSKEALKEPFLDFLLQVSWPKGNLYREFTVLVDPPSVYNQATIPVPISTESYTQPPVTTPQHQLYANGQSGEGEYGPTLGNDSLWSVAERARGQGGVSVEQMMIAIYEANPHAFYKENINALTAGKMLKIPEREAVLKLSRNQAFAEFNRHTKAWKNHLAPAHVETAKEKPVLSKVEESVLSGVERPVDNQLTLVAPTTAAVADHAVVASVNEQVSAGKKAGDVSSVIPEIIKDKPVQSVAEGTEEGAAVPTDGALQSKVAELEKQLAMMQELIALKDQQLAAVQSQSQANSVVQGLAVPSEVVAAKPVDQTTPDLQPVVVQPVAQPEPEVGSLFEPYYLGVAGVGAAILTLLGWLWWRKRKVDEETNTESMFASSSMIKTPEADESLSVPVVEDGADHDAGTVGESSFLSEFTPSDFESFDTDQGEIDPVSEADVYLAYGRYQQAEELIRQAIKDQPNRDECKLKLLEIFYANENKTAFEVYANELAEAGKRDEAEFWEQAAEMGREICPDSLLFSSGNNLFAVADNTTVKNGDESVAGDDRPNKESVNAGAALGESGSEEFVKGTTELMGSASKGGALDFDLSSMDTKESDEADKGVIAISRQAGALSGAQVEHIDLSSFSIESDEADNGVIASSVQAGTSSGAQVEGIDFDLSSFSIESDEADKGVIASSTFVGKSSGTQLEDIDFDLSSFSMDTRESDEADKGVIASSTFAGKSSEAQVEDIDFDLSSFSIDTKGSIEADKGVIASSTFAGKSSEAQVEDIDFDLSSFSIDTKGSIEADKGVIASSTLSDIPSGGDVANKKQEFESYEFDFSSNNAETKGIDDLDFSALENGDKNYQDDGFSVDRPLDLNDDLDSNFDFNFDFDLDMPPTTSSQDFKQYDEFGVSDLTDMDELETKLDLAKAYVDMGDADAAKDIAKEVLEQGTVEQKKIAQALLDELD